jgi:mitogen-activated protein kinase kinase 4
MPPGTLPIVPGGGRIPNTDLTSPVQQEKRFGLKMSFSQPNMRKPGLGFSDFQKAANAASATQKTVVPAAISGIGVGTSSTAVDIKFPFYKNSQSTGKLKINGEEHDFKAEDLADQGEIGRGAFGSVNKMVFKKNQCVMAVKRIRSTVDEREQKSLLMDLEVVMKSNECPFIVLFYGAIFKEGDCWICMEVMDISLDKFYKFIYSIEMDIIPEAVICQITSAVVRALNYLKDELKIIHRDVKPSNILLDRGGNIKLCDFGISGKLVDSIAKTRDAGCRPYMAPERIDPQRAKGYDVRSDVWSLGITLIELSTGRFPYPKWNSVFEQLQQVVHGDPPRLELKDPFTNRTFTLDFVNFVNTCLIKDELQRPKYVSLLKDPFIKRAESEATAINMVAYVNDVLERYNNAVESMDVDFPSDADSTMK